MLGDLSRHREDSGGKHELASLPLPNILRAHDVLASPMNF